MKPNGITCAACGQTNLPVTTGFCTRCQWDMLQLPSNASQDLQAYYTKRLTVHSNMYNAIADLQKQHGLLQQDKKTLGEDNNRLTTEINKIKKEMTVNKEQAKENKTHEKKISALEQKVKDQEAEIRALKKSTIKD